MGPLFHFPGGVSNMSLGAIMFLVGLGVIILGVFLLDRAVRVDEAIKDSTPYYMRAFALIIVGLILAGMGVL